MNATLLLAFATVLNLVIELGDIYVCVSELFKRTLIQVTDLLGRF